MKSIVFVLLLVHFFNYAQNYQTVVIDDDLDQTDEVSLNYIEGIAKEIVAQIGLPQNFVIKSDTTYRSNAKAEMRTDEDGRIRRYIVYDPSFFNDINDKANNKWAAISILAHEIGHHLNNHSLNNDGSTYTYELEADKWSGFVLRKMGANLKDAQSAILTLKNQKRPSLTHPPKIERLESIENGWRSGHKELDKFTPTDDITAEMVFAKYHNVIGIQDSTLLNSIRYNEQMISSEEIDLNNNLNEFGDILYGQGLFEVFANSRGFIKTSLKDSTQYLFMDSKFYFQDYKSRKRENWEIGYHPFQNSSYFEFNEIEVAHNINPVQGDIVYELFKSYPLDKCKFNRIMTMNSIPSYEVEIKELSIDQMKNRKSKKRTKVTLRYYDIENGLLHYISENIEEKMYRNEKEIGSNKLTAEIVIEDYFLEKAFLIPHKFSLKKTFFKNNSKLYDIEQKRIISDLELNPKNIYSILQTMK
jgi:hypothetical protein